MSICQKKINHFYNIFNFASEINVFMLCTKALHTSFKICYKHFNIKNCKYKSSFCGFRSHLSCRVHKRNHNLGSMFSKDKLGIIMPELA